VLLGLLTLHQHLREVSAMKSSTYLANAFFHDLKQYNRTNFKTIERANLDNPDSTIYKAFSSVVTRFFIFCEKHTEISPIELRILFFKLKIDLIARYFSEYPDGDCDALYGFQIELRNYLKDNKQGEHNELEVTLSI
jgi:hypothetical protein